MLSYLRIQNFALIEGLELELGPGLTVLTGETGAGKSIILAAVNLLLGGRAAADLIRQGQDQAVVEAVFSLPAGAPARERLASQGLAPDADGQLLVRRVVNREGRNRVQVAGALSTLGFLGELGPELVSLVGQHAHQSLLRPEEHLNLLDAYAGLEAQRQEVAQAVGRVQSLERRLAELRQGLARRDERRAWLREVIAELEAGELKPGEEEALKEERRRLANAEQMARLAEGVFLGLYGAEEGTALEVLAKVRGLMTDLTRLDEGLAPQAARLEAAYYELEDLAQAMRDHAEELVSDPARLDWVEGRLLAIQRLARKHGGGVEEALASLEQARAELEGLESGEQNLETLGRQRDEALAQALNLAQALSQARAQAAPTMAQAAQAELAQLGMAACQFEVRFAPPEGPAVQSPQGPLSPRGLEEAEFYIAPNPGEGFRRLTRIASGGELSRLFLALRGLVAQKAGAPTMIFDEVDAGIGGATGSAVGRKLKALATGAQVLCISHLPQIAAFGRAHLSVRKQVSQGRTSTVLTPLDAAGRLEEMTRMLGGQGQSAQRHAQELLDSAQQGLGF